MSNILLSIKERYVKKIITGEKTAEIRREFAPRKHVSRVYVYVPSPCMEVIGYFDIQGINRLPIDELWAASGKESALLQEEFYQYLNGKNEGVAIHFNDFNLLKNSISLRSMKALIPNFHPPQSFIYISFEIERLLAH